MSKKRHHPHAHLLRLAQLAGSNPSAATPWPGVADPSLAHPDQVKFDYAEFVARAEPSRTKLAHFEKAAGQGPLGWDASLSGHWAMEEFFWHGAPGDAWHPLEAYLAAHAERFPPAAAEQLRRWKAARVGLYAVGAVSAGTVGLQAWDPVTRQTQGPPLRAIALNLGGVNFYRGHRGRITLTYLAPWSPEADLRCAMGYGVALKQRQAVDLAVIMLALQQPALASRPYPWRLSREAERQALRGWREREWHNWLTERLTFPFQAFVALPPRGDVVIADVTSLLPADAANARHFGIYLTVPQGSAAGVVVSGLTGITPTDLASPNWLPIAEYHAYRQLAGPPPGAAGGPAFVRVR